MKSCFVEYDGRSIGQTRTGTTLFAGRSFKVWCIRAMDEIHSHNQMMLRQIPFVNTSDQGPRIIIDGLKHEDDSKDELWRRALGYGIRDTFELEQKKKDFAAGKFKYPILSRLTPGARRVPNAYLYSPMAATDKDIITKMHTLVDLSKAPPCRPLAMPRPWMLIPPTISQDILRLDGPFGERISNAVTETDPLSVIISTHPNKYFGWPTAVRAGTVLLGYEAEGAEPSVAIVPEDGSKADRYEFPKFAKLIVSADQRVEVGDSLATIPVPGDHSHLGEHSTNISAQMVKDNMAPDDFMTLATLLLIMDSVCVPGSRDIPEMTFVPFDYLHESCFTFELGHIAFEVNEVQFSFPYQDVYALIWNENGVGLNLINNYHINNWLENEVRPNHRKKVWRRSRPAVPSDHVVPVHNYSIRVVAASVEDLNKENA